MNKIKRNIELVQSVDDFADAIASDIVDNLSHEKELGFISTFFSEFTDKDRFRLESSISRTIAHELKKVEGA